MHQVKLHPLSVPLLRVLLSGIFLVAGSSHLFNADTTVQRLENARFGDYALFFGSSHFLVVASGGLMLLAGCFLLAGIKTRIAAAILVLLLLPITFTVQLGQVSSLGPLFKNIAILGGLLFFLLNDFTKTPKKKTQ